MKVYMIWDYTDHTILGDGFFNPYIFSTFDKAKKFLEDFNSEGVLHAKSEKKNTYTYRFYDGGLTEYYKYEIFEVEVDRV